jgi:4'-phosphopantetheinyl transferase
VNVPRLAPGDVCVVRLPLDERPGGWAADSDSLSADERQRAGRFRFERDAAAFSRTRAGLRTLLGAYLGMPPASLRFRLGPFGKPSLEWDCPFDFNVSHSDGLALVAITRGRQVGIDVERVRPICGWRLAGFLSPGELAQIERLPERDREQAFFRCWVRKEAYLKATGVGLHSEPTGLTVSVDAQTPPTLVHVEDSPEAPEIWTLCDLDAGPHHHAALAIQAPIGMVMTREMPAR